jgi:hypothetical protein
VVRGANRDLQAQRAIHAIIARNPGYAPDDLISESRLGVRIAKVEWLGAYPSTDGNRSTEEKVRTQ